MTRVGPESRAGLVLLVPLVPGQIEGSGKLFLAQSLRLPQCLQYRDFALKGGFRPGMLLGEGLHLFPFFNGILAFIHRAIRLGHRFQGQTRMPGQETMLVTRMALPP